MAPNCDSTDDMYEAAKEINASLLCLRREQHTVKKTVTALQDQLLTQQHHMNRIDELIDGHQTKVHALMQMALNQREKSRLNQSQPTPNEVARYEPQTTSDQQLQVSHIPIQLDADQDDINDQDSNLPIENQIQGNSVIPAPVEQIEFDDDDDNCLADENQTSAFPAIKVEETSFSEQHPQFDYVVEPPVSALDQVAVAQAQQATTSANPAFANEGSAPYHRSTRYYPRRTIRDRIRALSTKGRFTAAPLPPTTTTKGGQTYMPKANQVTYNSSPVQYQAANHLIDSTRRIDAQGNVSYHCCGYVFVGRANCFRHVMSVHAKHRPYKCRLCPYATAQKSNLRRHEAKRHEIT